MPLFSAASALCLPVHKIVRLIGAKKGVEKRGGKGRKMDEKSGVKKIFVCANKWLIFAQKNAKNKKNAIIYKIICTGQKKAVSLPRKLKNAREKRINRRQLGNGVPA